MFTSKEEKILKQIQQNPGEIKFFEDIAEHFITKSQLEISTYSQLAYVNLSAAKSNTENVTEALSEYFEILVFIKKLENAEVVFHIPYTALENNTVKIGPEPDNGVHRTIADADLLIQIFQYASKKYVFLPVLNIQKEVQLKKDPEKTDYFRIALLSLLILFIAFVGYHAHLEREQLKSQQSEISRLIDNNRETVLQLESQLLTSQKTRLSEFQKIEGQFSSIKNDLQEQHKMLKNTSYRNYRNFKELEALSLKVDSLFTLK